MVWLAKKIKNVSLPINMEFVYCVLTTYAVPVWFAHFYWARVCLWPRDRQIIPASQPGNPRPGSCIIVSCFVNCGHWPPCTTCAHKHVCQCSQLHFQFCPHLSMVATDHLVPRVHINMFVNIVNLSNHCYVDLNVIEYCHKRARSRDCICWWHTRMNES